MRLFVPQLEGNHAMTIRITGLLALSVVIPMWGQALTSGQSTTPVPARWTILFRSDDPSLWGKNVRNSRGEQIAIPLKYAPAKFRYLRLRRMDTGEDLILPLTRSQLQNGKPGSSEAAFWWNGTAKEEWEGRHLGIVQRPRH
jgi:hypothetical protein